MTSEPQSDPVKRMANTEKLSVPFRKKLVLVASGLFLLSIIFPPVKYGTSEVTVRFLDGWKLITDMERAQSLNWGVLFLEWALLAGLSWLVLYIRSDEPSG